MRPGCGWSDCRAPGRPYPCGERCPEHTPARLAGRDEPGRTASPYRPNFTRTPLASTVLDDRAVASGRRHSNPHERAQAVAREKARHDAHGDAP